MTNVATVGLGFGAEFIPIYQACPGANVHAICRRDESELHKVGDQFGIEHLSFIQGGGHGGSHPHLENEFLSALREDRDPWHNAVVSANWTCVGICAHESATKGGEIVRLPDFTLTT